MNNYNDLPTDVLDAFLREANSNTYANENVKKAVPLRPGSKDYHFEKGDLTFMTLILAPLNLSAKKSFIKATSRFGA